MEASQEDERLKNSLLHASTGYHIHMSTGYIIIVYNISCFIQTYHIANLFKIEEDIFIVIF